MAMRIFAMTGVHPDPERISITRAWTGEPLTEPADGEYIHIRLAEFPGRAFRVERLYETEAYISVSGDEAELLLSSGGWVSEQDHYEQLLTKEAA